MKKARLIARPSSPGRTWGLAGFALAVLAAAGYLLFELGRVRSGYSLVDAQQRRAELKQEIEELDALNEQLRQRIAVLETSQEVDKEAYRQVEDNLADLQSRIQTQEEELAFYRGIVSPEDGVAGLRIQELELLPRDAETDRRFLLRLVLVQAVKHDRRVSGVVNLEVAGQRDGETVSYPLGELVAEDSAASLAFSFRYFQDFQKELVLPTGFKPDRVEVELRPKGRGAKPVARVFDWAASRRS